MKIAPPSNDIIWRRFSNRDRNRKTFIRLLLWVILIFVSVILITPLTLLDNINPIIELMEQYLGGIVYVKSYFQLFLTPLCLYLFNYVLIPTLIDFLIRFERRSRKSHNAKTKLRKNFFFFILNQILLPLAGFSTIMSFFQYLASKDLADWPETLASKMSPSGSFFLRYIVQVSLLSNTFQLLSLPKIFWDHYNTHTWYCKKKKKSKTNIGRYIFSHIQLNCIKTQLLTLGWGATKRRPTSISLTSRRSVFPSSQWCSCSVRACRLLVSHKYNIIVPFGCLFFVFKYFIDKYNIV